MNQAQIFLRDVTWPPQQLHIASLVAHVRPEQFSNLHNWLLKPPAHIHVDIYATEPSQGKFVMVTESVNEKAIVDFLDELRGRTGVLNAALVYHEYLTAQDLADEQEENT